MVGKVSQTRQIRARALQTTAMGLALVLGAPAFAQCAPQQTPANANPNITCTGVDADGVTITTSGTAVSVPVGASVLGSGGPAVAVRLPSNRYGSPVTLSVAGRVDGGNQAGVSLSRQPSASGFGYADANLSMTIAAGGSVSGVNAVSVNGGDTGGGRASVSIDNAGSLTGTGGTALLAASFNAGFSSIINRNTGFIGAISGPVGAITNAGTIDGGTRSAVNMSESFDFGSGGVTNSGTITANSTAATIENSPGRQLTNSGNISNRGTGAAVAGDRLTITNAADGRISTAGATAIRATSYLNLTNTGVINGDVLTAASPTYFTTGSTVDSSAGAITGNITFGDGEDVLVARYDSTGLVTGVSGAIDGGEGNDTVRVGFATDTTLTRSLTLPTHFERLTLAPEANRTAILAAGFEAPGPIGIAGSGTVINRTTLSGATQVVLAGGSYTFLKYPSFINEGTIRTTAGVAGTFAVNLNSYIDSFENIGTVSATGDGVSFSSQGSLINSGTITAAGTGLSLFSDSFTNSGTIRSTGGTGAILSGSSVGRSTNSGRIEGSTTAVALSGSLTNTGTITSAGAGVTLSPYGTLDNRAGGVVTGGSVGVGVGGLGYLFNATVANAGTINGDVRLAGSQASSFNGNRYFALSGGVLNGNLVLGGNDTLVTELGSGSGPFAGVTGTVQASGSLLRYRTRGTASATLTSPTGFTETGFDLFDDAALTLTGTSARSLLLAGTGSVDLTADLTASSQPAIRVGFVLQAPGETSSGDRGLSITSRGALVLEGGDALSYPYALVAMDGSEDDFTNAGTMTVRGRTTMYYDQTSAIVNGRNVANTGTITLDTAVGVSGARTLTNSGSIVQAAGGGAATGLRNVGTLTNSGTIDVASHAVLIDYNTRTITNSGRIASSGAAAISVGSYDSSYGLTIANLAGGTIAADGGRPAVRMSGGTLDNAGTITGSVNLGYTSYGPSYTSATYIARGGTIAGDLLFGRGTDMLIAFNSETGVSGTIDGGDGDDLLIHARDTSGTVTLGSAGVANFESLGIRALGTETVVTANAGAPIRSDVRLSGDGAIVNNATIHGWLRTGFNGFWYNYATSDLVLASLTNQGTIHDGFQGDLATSFANTGSIGWAALQNDAVRIYNIDGLSFDNSGTIAAAGSAVALFTSDGGITATNTGSITGAFQAIAGHPFGMADAAPLAVAFTNAGTITAEGQAVALQANNLDGKGDTVSLNNSGTIEATGANAFAASLWVYSYREVAGASTISVSNSGTIRANGGGTENNVTTWYGDTSRYTDPAAALVLGATPATTLTVVNAAGGVIEATGERSAAILAFGSGLDLSNAGTIRGGTGTVLADDDEFGGDIGSSYLAGAIHTVGGANDAIVNTGTIIGSIALGFGDDRVENLGTLRGDVFLGAGDDSFLQLAGATLNGTVDGGEGTDGLVIDATGGGAVNGDQFVGFERFSQIGEGTVAYSGTFRFDTIGVSGGTVTVGAGQTLSSAGEVTVTGSDAAESVFNNGTIAGSVALAGGDDRLTNNGAIRGSVSLGSGDDQFVQGIGSTVTGSVDGGGGNDLYTVILAGDRSGIGSRTGFERLAVEGRGTLSLALDQDFTSLSLAGANLDLSLGEHRIGSVAGGDAAELLAVDGDLARVALGGGDDRLSLGTTRAGGRYDGGTGNDVLRFTANGPVTLAGTAANFEQVALAGNALTIAGTLGSGGAPLVFDAGGQQVTLASGGTLAGVIELGAGDDGLRLAIGSILDGTVSGGAGNDSLTLELAGARTLTNGSLTGFETLVTEGAGTLTLAGTHGYDRVAARTDLAVQADASLTAPVQFGAGDQRFVIAGRYVGSVDGGAGIDTIAVSGGHAAAPVAFGNIANVENLAMTGGYATIGGSAALGTIDVTGGRLVGLAGSTIGASQIVVGPGGTFGSAGIVNGNLSIAGTLSPGASPGTMTVNGNVSLQGGSVSVFELTPTQSDKLLVNGAVTIGSGSTLQIVPGGTLRPGTSYDLIVASGGITGSYSTVSKPDSLFGFVVQRADRIQLLGEFLNDATFSPQVSRSVAYANTTLAAQSATSSLFAAVPALLTGAGASDPRGFAQLTPEAYSAASQIGVDNALALTGAARGPAFAASGADVRFYTFAQALGSWHRLGADGEAGTSATRSRSYGFLGGVGIGNASWSIGGFAGYLNDRQQIDALGARTKADGVAAGVHGRLQAASGFGLTASILYNGGEALTERALPGATTASGRYDLHSWVSDLSVSYDLNVAADWTLRPHAGITYVRTIRDGVAESGGAFALTVARDRHVAGFADAGLSIGRSEASDAPFRPFVSLGARYQIEGRRTDALAGYAGGGLGLDALGPQRAELVGTAAAGIGYRLPSGLDLFAGAASQTGGDDHQETVTAGVRMRF